MKLVSIQVVGRYPNDPTWYDFSEEFAQASPYYVCVEVEGGRIPLPKFLLDGTPAGAVARIWLSSWLAQADEDALAYNDLRFFRR